METLKLKLKAFGRKRKHLRRLETRIFHLKYDILNDALDYKTNETKIKLFHKYNKRLKLITFFK